MDSQKTQEVDKTIYDVAHESLKEKESVRTKTIREFDSLVAKTCRPHVGKVLDAASAIVILQELRQLVEEELKSLVQRFSRMRWLWYLRRMPLSSIFVGKLKSTIGYDTNLLEVLCGYAPAEQNQPTMPLTYPVNTNDIRRCLQLCYGIQCLSQLHVFLRFAGKGALIKFANVGPVESKVDNATKDGIRLYDKRLENSGIPMNRLGTFVNSEINKELSLFPYFRLEEPEFLGPLFAEDFKTAEVLSNCCPRPMSLAGLSELARNPALSAIQFLDYRASSLLILLLSLPKLLPQLDAAPRTLMKNGYFILSNELLSQGAEWAFDEAAQSLREISRNIPVPANATLVLQELKNMSPRLWPIDYPSPLTPVGTDGVCCDVVGASIAFLQLCEFPRLEGSAANARAAHFELATQAIINQSAYKPSEALGEIRGRTLILKGKKLTDIDAIGAQGDTLLLIQCKSLVYRDEYDMGETRGILNARATVENGLREWKKRIKEIEENPIGDNYDLSEYKNFFPILCTPQPIFVPMGECTEEVLPGLRATCTPQELSDFLDD